MTMAIPFDTANVSACTYEEDARWESALRSVIRVDKRLVPVVSSTLFAFQTSTHTIAFKMLRDGLQGLWPAYIESTENQLQEQRWNRKCALGKRRALRTDSPRRRMKQAQWLSHDELVSINESFGFQPLSSETSRRLESDVSIRFGDERIDRKVCIVTDEWTFREKATRIAIDSLPLRAMEVVLSGKRWATDAISSYYDCSHFDDRLHGMLLSCRGFEVQGTAVFAWISNAALAHLRLVERLEDLAEARPPRFAIADCFVAGVFDEVTKSTIIERQAVSLAQMRGVVKVLFGGPGNVLQSHLLCWDNRHATVSSQLPRQVKKENFQLVLAGPFTTRQELLMSKKHGCSGERITCLHQLLQRINPLYHDIPVDDMFAHCEQQPHVTRLPVDEETDALVRDARARQVSVANSTLFSHETNASAVESEDEVIVETQTVLVETILDSSERDHLQSAFEATTGETPELVARHSSVFLQTSDEHYAERLFPWLFTFGTGGFGATRSNSYTKREIMLHYLNLSSNIFAEDGMFKLVMFDYLGTQRVKNSMFIRVGQEPSIALQMMKVSAEDLRKVMEYRKNKRTARRIEQAPAPCRTSEATNVIKSINASAAKMWGSNEERESFARKVSAMTVMYGAPTLFFTLTPNPDNSIAVAFWSGRQLPNGRPNDLSECSIFNMPSSRRMERYTMANTVIQAHYFQLCCKVLIDVLFGWDLIARKPRSKPGILGHTEAFFYALEQQGRLRVHAHGTVWIAGMPKSKRDWDTVVRNPALHQKYEEYCASVLSAELPVFRGEEQVQCFAPQCQGVLHPVEVHPKYKHILKKLTPAPIVAACGQCEQQLSDADVARGMVDRKWMNLDDEERAKSTNEAVDQIRIRLGGFSAQTRTADVQLSRSLLKDQVHAYQHTHSCVKGRSNTRCRYNFFKDVVPATRLSDSGNLELRRPIGCQWLNAYIPIWRRILHFNMDARMLLSGTGLQACRYAIAYCVKSQCAMDNIAVVEMAFQRRMEREATMASSRTSYQQGLGRLLSLAYSTSGVMEVGGPLATAILLEGGAGKFSCSFERLVLLEGLNAMTDKDIEATIVHHNDELYTDASIRTYVKRPKCLEKWSWYNFCAWINVPRGNTCSTECFFAGSNHDNLGVHLKAHDMGTFEFPHVPEVIGPKLYDMRRLGNEDYENESESYYRCTLLLFCPFRDPKAFLDTEQSARTYFQAWIQCIDESVRRTLDHYQQYYYDVDEANAFHARQRDETDAEIRDYSDVDTGSQAMSADEHWYGSASFIATTDMYVVEDCGIDAGNVAYPQRPELTLSAQIHDLLSSYVGQLYHPPDESGTLIVRRCAIKKRDIQQFKQAAAREILNDSLSSTEAFSNSVRQGTAISLQFLQDATQSLYFDSAQTSENDLGDYASVKSVSRYFKLNEQQHAAFVLIAVPLLYKIAGQPLPKTSVFHTSPIAVTGAAGSGKSRIVDAVRAIATSWKRPRSVVVVASTGIAAAGLHGSTLHNSVGIGINQTRLPSHLNKPSEELLQVWDPALCVIADEVAMVDLTLLALWEEALRKVKECQDPFGGLIPVLMFDFFQLHTVKGCAIHKTASGGKSLTDTQRCGSRIYQSIEKVVYLTESMRFKQDPEWGELLLEARLGRWSERLKHILQNEVRSVQESPTTEFIQVISTDNATRVAINNRATQVAIDSVEPSRLVYGIPARISRPLSAGEADMIRSLPDNKTGHIPLFFRAYIGMPVCIKANQCIEKGVANGATGFVYHIDWAPETSFRPQRDGVLVASTPPLNIYVCIHNCCSSLRFPGLPSSWPAAVMPIIEMATTVKLKEKTASIKGFPLTPAFGSTVHGVQGETREKLAITNLRPPTVRNVDRHALYTAISRVCTRTGLYWLGDRLCDEDFDYFRPSEETMQEDHRLRALAEVTAKRVEEAIRL